VSLIENSIIDLSAKHENEHKAFNDRWVIPMKAIIFSPSTNAFRSMSIQNFCLMNAHTFDKQWLSQPAVDERERWEITEHSRTMPMESEVELKGVKARQTREMKTMLLVNHSLSLTSNAGQNQLKSSTSFN
jgi:hypothetical protein